MMSSVQTFHNKRQINSGADRVNSLNKDDLYTNSGSEGDTEKNFKRDLQNHDPAQSLKEIEETLKNYDLENDWTDEYKSEESSSEDKKFREIEKREMKIPDETIPKLKLD